MHQSKRLVLFTIDGGHTTIRLDGTHSKVTVALPGPQIENPRPGMGTLIDSQRRVID